MKVWLVDIEQKSRHRAVMVLDDGVTPDLITRGDLADFIVAHDDADPACTMVSRMTRVERFQEMTTDGEPVIPGAP